LKRPIEKAFIETEAYFEFKKAIQYAIRQIEIERNADKSILREMYGSINIKEPVKDSLKRLKEKIEKNKTIEEPLKKDLVIRLTKLIRNTSI
jgi:hypothetical protein